jgi:hypothetical protein
MSYPFSQTNDFSQVNSDILSETSISNLINHFNIEKHLQKSGIVKRNGVSVLDLFTLLFRLTINRKRSVYEGLRYDDSQDYKSIVNNFLNAPYYDWRELLYSVSSLFHSRYKHDVGECNVLIIDDTAKVKHGKKTENVAVFRDHSEGVTYSGYQVPICVLSNDRSATVVDFELKIGNQRTSGSKDGNYPTDSHIYQRQKEGHKTKHTISINMIDRVLKRRFKFQYVLWDSWYNSPKSFDYVFGTLVKKGIHLVSRVKRNNDKYIYENKEYNIKELYEIAGEWREIKGTNTLTKSIDIQIINTDDKNRSAKGSIRLCFYKFVHQKEGDYIALISTNTELTPEQVCDLYTKRWSIEVVIKDFKTYFGFYQSMSSKYAPQIADFTLKCVYYLLICSLKERGSNKSPYQLLFDFVQELEKHNLYVLTRDMFTKLLKQMAELNLIEVKIKLKYLLHFIMKFLHAEIYIDKIEEVEGRK